VLGNPPDGDPAVSVGRDEVILDNIVSEKHGVGF